MTIEERFERMEHVTAGHIEQARKDYEEYRQWRRDHLATVDAIWKAMERRDKEYAELRRETQLQFQQTETQLKTLGEETDRRIQTLVTAIGELIQRM